MASSYLLRAVLLLLAGFLHTEVAISASVIQESSAVSHQGNIIGQTKEDGSSDSLQQNENGDIECTIPFMDIGGRCLLLDTLTEGTWSEKKLFCQELRGEMLKMNSCNILYAIVQFIKDNDIPDHKYWIGGSDSEREGHFVHLDGTPMMMGTPFWEFSVEGHFQQPNGGNDENCVAMLPESYYTLSDENCYVPQNVICQQAD